MTNQNDCPMTPSRIRDCATVLKLHGHPSWPEKLFELATWLEELESPWVSVTGDMPAKDVKRVIARFKFRDWVTSIEVPETDTEEKLRSMMEFVGITYWMHEPPLPESEVE